MNKCTIAISSVNYALRGEKILFSKNVRTRIVKLQPTLTKKGCAYGLEVYCRDLPDAISALDGAGIPFSEIVR